MDRRPPLPVCVTSVGQYRVSAQINAGSVCRDYIVAFLVHVFLIDEVQFCRKQWSSIAVLVQQRGLPPPETILGVCALGQRLHAQ